MNMLKHTATIIAVALSLAASSSCGTDDPEPEPVPPQGTETPEPEPEPEPELTVNPYENYYNNRDERRYVDSRLWRAWQETPATLFGLDKAFENAEPEEENKQELDRQWKELMFGQAAKG